MKIQKAPLFQRLLWTAKDVAEAFGISLSLVKRLRRERVLPRPVTLTGMRGEFDAEYAARNGTTLYWRRTELIDWYRAGCPEQSKWKWTPSQLVTVSEALEIKRRQLRIVEEKLAAKEETLRGYEQ